MNLKQLALAWLAYRGHSAHIELGLNSWGKLRADIWAFKTVKGQIRSTLIELKSGFPDFDSDQKFHKYREFANQCYLAIDLSKLNPRQIKKVRARTKEAGFGLLDIRVGECRLHPKRAVSLKVKVVIPCKIVEVAPKITHLILKRIAFRSGTHKRNLKDKL